MSLRSDRGHTSRHTTRVQRRWVGPGQWETTAETTFRTTPGIHPSETVPSSHFQRTRYVDLVGLHPEPTPLEAALTEARLEHGTGLAPTSRWRGPDPGWTAANAETFRRAIALDVGIGELARSPHHRTWTVAEVTSGFRRPLTRPVEIDLTAVEPTVGATARAAERDAAGRMLATAAAMAVLRDTDGTWVTAPITPGSDLRLSHPSATVTPTLRGLRAIVTERGVIRFAS